MKTRFLLLILSFVWLAPKNMACASTIAADSVSRIKPGRNLIYVEAGGSAFLGSLNYERLIPLSESGIYMAARIGGSFVPNWEVKNKMDYFLWVPAGVSVFYGKGKIKYEAGIGASYYADRYFTESSPGRIYKKENSQVFPVFTAGFRILPPDERLFIKFGLNVIMFGNYSWFFPPVMPWPGFGMGYNF